MNILIWLQAIGGVLVLLLAVFFMGTFALDSLREFLWKANQSKREAIRKQIAQNILEVGNWLNCETKEGALLMQIIGEQLRDHDWIDAARAREEYKRAMESKK